MKRSLALIVCLFAGTVATYAADDATTSGTTRPAVREDLPGQWEMFYQHVSNVNNKSPQDLLKYQVYEFREDGGLKTITATKRVTQEDRELFLRIMPDATTWEMPREGLLVIRRSELDADGIDAYVVTQPYQDSFLSGSPPLEPGDLVLVYFDELRQPYLRRYLRPIIPDPEPEMRPKKASPFAPPPQKPTAPASTPQEN